MMVPPYSSFHSQTRSVELLAPELGARHALGGEALLDDRLGGDARVVGAADPQRLVAVHPARADEQVLDRVVEGVAHVQRARDVGRRHRDRVGRPVRVGVRVADAGLAPRLGPARLDLRRIEAVRDFTSTLAGLRSYADSSAARSGASVTSVGAMPFSIVSG